MKDTVIYSNFYFIYFNENIQKWMQASKILKIAFFTA